MRLTPAGCLALAWLSCVETAYAQELHGLRTRVDGGLDVAWVDPTNGAVTSLTGGIPAGFVYSSGTGAIDPRNQRLFTTVLRNAETDWRVYSVSLRDGAVVSNPYIAGSGTTSSFFAVEYDEAEGVLYGMRGPGDGTRRLCRINVATGAMADVGTGTPTSTSSSGSPGALDAAGNRFFFVGTPSGQTDASLLVFDTGAIMGTGILSSPVMTGTSANPILGLAYDPQEHALYGIRSLAGKRQLVSINTATGAVTPLGPGTAGVVSSAGADALDHVHNRYFLVGTANGETSARLYTFDTADGSLDASPVMPAQDVAILQWRETAPLKGDFNVDGATDLLLRNSANTTEAWLMNGTARGGLASLVPTPTTDETIAGVDNFDGNGFNDLAVYRPSTGTVEFWLLGGASGTTRQGAAAPLIGASALPPNWKLSATGDFNRDSWPDLLWRNTTSQKLVVWALSGTTKVGNIIPTPDQAVDANWEVVAALDFNRDGNRDLLWYNATSGRIVTWNMNHLLVRTDGNFTNPMAAGDANWRVVAGGDYGVGPDGPDAAAPVLASNDLVWRNAGSGRMVVWHMDLHRQRTGGLFTSPDSGSPAPTNWNVVGPR